MKKSTILATALLGATIAGKANADFYDGCRGPNDLQLDQRLTLSEATPNYTLLPKLFLDNDEDGNGFFSVAPFSYTPGENPAAGYGPGGFLQLGKINLLGVSPVVYSAEGEVTNINPTVFATLTAGDHVLFDARINYLASINNEGDAAHNVGFGLGVGFAIDNVILGFDIGTGFDPSNAKPEQLREQLSYQGIIRVDLDKNHKNWIQAYLGKDAVGVGFRSNFDWR